MAASAELLISVLTAVPHPREELLPASPERPETMDLYASQSESDLDGCCSCGCVEAPLTSEPPLSDVSPLTSEPPLATESPLTSESTGVSRSTDIDGGPEHAEI